jgi:hypothetical protein
MYWSDRPDGFGSSFVEEQVEDWVKLERCAVCGQLWSVDEWDKYQDQVAAKISNRETWEAESEAARKRLLLKSRGGVSAQRCAWGSYSGQAVNGVAFCLDHLYQTGARR